MSPNGQSDQELPKWEQALRATTWQEWQAAQPHVSRYGATVHPLPWALDWLRNPVAPLPPGMILVRCLCGPTAAYPPDWRGRTERGMVVRPAITVGKTCAGCGAPFQQKHSRDEPYVIELDPPRHMREPNAAAVLTRLRRLKLLD